MRIGLTFIGVCLSCPLGAFAADQALPLDRSLIDARTPDVEVVLGEAAEILLKQPELPHSFWIAHGLVEIGDLQIRAGDFEGALRSIRGCSYKNDRNDRLVKLAEALARAGRRERATEALRLLDAGHGWSQDYLDDVVQAAWIEPLIARGKFADADKAVESLNYESSIAEARRKLAAAHARAGEPARAAEQFARAVDAAAKVPDEYARARALWEIADAQGTTGDVAAAQATIGRLVDRAEIKEPWARMSALREAAVVAAKAGDAPTGRALFARAIEAVKSVKHKAGALETIGMEQAGVGYLDDARQTAVLIWNFAEGFHRDGAHEEVLVAVAAAQLKQGDVEGAMRTALSVKFYLQFRDDALGAIVEHQIVKRDLSTALVTAKQIPDPSRRATAMLGVARAHAAGGDHGAARDVAAQIELKAETPLLHPKKPSPFDYRLPRTWGACYDIDGPFSFSLEQSRRQITAETAAAAMTLAETLGESPAEPYATAFDEIWAEEVVRSLARAHAATGDPNQALAWARRIGSDDKIADDDDHVAQSAVQRRVHALIGVAEGTLDRRNKPTTR